MVLVTNHRILFMQRLNFTLDKDAVTLLKKLASDHYGGNKSHTVRAALERLAADVENVGWIVAGYMPVRIKNAAFCHTCGSSYEGGAILFCLTGRA